MPTDISSLLWTSTGLVHSSSRGQSTKQSKCGSAASDNYFYHKKLGLNYISYQRRTLLETIVIPTDAFKSVCITTVISCKRSCQSQDWPMGWGWVSESQKPTYILLHFWATMTEGDTFFTGFVIKKLGSQMVFRPKTELFTLLKMTV